MEHLELHSTHVDGVDVIKVVGELDIATHQRLREKTRELFEAGSSDILVDLSETTFMDSIALGALIGARREAYMRKGSLAVVLGHGAALRIFDLTGMGRAIKTYESVDEWREQRSGDAGG